MACCAATVRESTGAMTETGLLSLCLHLLRRLQFLVLPSLLQRQPLYQERASVFEGPVAATKVLFRIYQTARTAQTINPNYFRLLEAVTALPGS